MFVYFTLISHSIHNNGYNLQQHRRKRRQFYYNRLLRIIMKSADVFDGRKSCCTQVCLALGRTLWFKVAHRIDQLTKYFVGDGVCRRLWLIHVPHLCDQKSPKKKSLKISFLIPLKPQPPMNLQILLSIHAIRCVVKISRPALRNSNDSNERNSRGKWRHRD